MADVELTPEHMLALYKQQSPDHLTEQFKMFKNMRMSEQIELLFYMVSHTNMITQTLHRRIAPEEAVTKPPPPLDPVN